MTTAASSAAALRRLEALFENVNLDETDGSNRKKSLSFEAAVIETKPDKNCDVHGKENRKESNGYTDRRGSLGNILNANRRNSNTAGFGFGLGNRSVTVRRDSMPALHVIHNHPPLIKRDSLSGLGLPPARSPDPQIHPSNFPSTLRKESTTSSTNNLRRDSFSSLRRDSIASSTGNIRKDSLRRDSISSIGSSRKDSIGSNGSGRRKRLFSTDSLDYRRNSWDMGRRGSSSSSGGWDDPIWEGIYNGKVRE